MLKIAIICVWFCLSIAKESKSVDLSSETSDRTSQLDVGHAAGFILNPEQLVDGNSTNLACTGIAALNTLCYPASRDATYAERC